MLADLDIDNYCSFPEERGFYLQLLARVTYNYSKSKSTQHQFAAYKKNHSLLLPNSINPVESFTYRLSRVSKNIVMSDIVKVRVEHSLLLN